MAIGNGRSDIGAWSGAVAANQWEISDVLTFRDNS
eukprot:COSAG02_NODE_11041_length_1806_cov_3.099004_3_plen_34_part_01